MLAEEPYEFGKDFRWDRKIRMAQSYAEKSILCYIEIWVSCAVMLLFLENIHEARGGLFARSVRHCRSRGVSCRACQGQLYGEKAAFNNRHTYCLLELQTSKLLTVKAYSLGVDILNVMR